MTSLLDDWKLDLDAKKVVAATFIDLRKAFDTVDHELLLRKLELYNFSSTAVNLIKDYLAGRSFLVELDKIKSDSVKIYSGVPQGSILGPLLFLVFINDIGSICERTRICLFADDTIIYSSSKYLVDALDLHLGLTLFSKWCEENRIVVN